jgi:toxin YoeB
MYELELSEVAIEDLRYFKRSEPRCHMKALSLLGELMEHPYTGSGKPERLRYELSGCWSRRINPQHRLVYKVMDDLSLVHVLAMRYHYRK